MQRRDFAKTVAAGALGMAMDGHGSRAEASISGHRPREVLMKVGCQSRNGTSQESLEFLARHGVFHMDPGEPEVLENREWSLESAQRQVEEAARYGVKIEAYHLPLSSAGITRVRFPNVMLGKNPERDREIEILQQNIEVAGRAGVPRLLYNTIILPILRTGTTLDPNRGNASYSTFDLAAARASGMDRQIIPEAGTVDIDTIYERITYLLDRILPVAEEYNVKLGNHIADPPAPVGFGGITRWNSPEVFDGIRRFAQLYDSPSHGLNLCLGSTAEGLRNPRTEILPIIRWLGERNQIFNIHLRNIKGGWGHFQEVYPDNGDMDFIAVMRTLKDVGYDGMVMPDHVPSHPAEGSRDQAFAYAYGYINALMQLVRQEG